MATDDDAIPFLPLSPAVFHVLVSLADGDRHGYAIIREVSERTEGAQRMGAGTLYAILKRLLESELIVEVPAPRDADDERRRYYRLTPLGRRVAKAEVERLERASTLARSTRLFGRTRTT